MHNIWAIWVTPKMAFAHAVGTDMQPRCHVYAALKSHDTWITHWLLVYQCSVDLIFGGIVCHAKWTIQIIRQCKSPLKYHTESVSGRRETNFVIRRPSQVCATRSRRIRMFRAFGIFRLTSHARSNWAKYLLYSPIVEHLRFMQFDAIGLLIGARNKPCRYGWSMLCPASARIVFVKIMGERVPATANTHHYMRSQNLKLEDSKEEFIHVYCWVT